jgi:hypothetical protein
MRTEPLIPYASQTVATSTTSAVTLLGSGNTVRLVNQSVTAGDIVFAALGDASTVATANSVAIMPGQTVYLSRQPTPSNVPAVSGMIGNNTHVALIAAANTPNVNIVTGEGGGGAGT